MIFLLPQIACQFHCCGAWALCEVILYVFSHIISKKWRLLIVHMAYIFGMNITLSSTACSLLCSGAFSCTLFVDFPATLLGSHTGAHPFHYLLMLNDSLCTCPLARRVFTEKSAKHVSVWQTAKYVHKVCTCTIVCKVCTFTAVSTVHM